MTSGVLSAVLLEYTYKLYYTVVVGGRQGPIHFTQLPVSTYTCHTTLTPLLLSCRQILLQSTPHLLTM